VGLQASLRALLLACGLGGCLLLVIAELSTLYEVRAAGNVTASVSGGEQHNYALLVIGLAALPLTVGAVRGSRAAMAAVSGLGLLALAIIVLGGDLHDIHASGVAGQLYERASAGPKSGFYEETAGVALLLISGGAGLVLSAPGAWLESRTPTAQGEAGDAGDARDAGRSGGDYQR
jgi:hypothetical protein